MIPMLSDGSFFFFLISVRIDPPRGYDLSGQPLPGDHSDSGSSEQSAAPNPNRHTQRRGRRANHGRSGALRNASTLQRQRTSYSIFAHQVQII